VTGPAGTEFDRATAVTALGGGAWASEVDAGWFAGRGPNGGYLAAMVLRAMAAEVDDPGRQPRSLTCHYLRPPAAGPVRIAVTVERAGRATSTLTARLLQDDRPCVLAVAAFGIEVPASAAYAGAAPAFAAP
jgi:acyl-CoA thioesterase